MKSFVTTVPTHIVPPGEGNPLTREKVSVLDLLNEVEL